MLEKEKEVVVVGGKMKDKEEEEEDPNENPITLGTNLLQSQPRNMPSAESRDPTEGMKHPPKCCTANSSPRPH